jgi:hypothetical protein
MKWMKERDLLIAQTMAFVQSVTGKAPAAAEMPALPKEVAVSAAPLSVETFEVETVKVETVEVETRHAKVVEPARPAASARSDIALPLVRLPSASTPPAVTPAAAVEALPRTARAPIAGAPREIPSPGPFARLDLREDFQSEIRARVASFRAHQERFNREREAYCAATMAKVHAVLKEGERPPPRPEK